MTAWAMPTSSSSALSPAAAWWDGGSSNLEIQEAWEAAEGASDRACLSGSYRAARDSVRRAKRRDQGWWLRSSGRYVELTFADTKRKPQPGKRGEVVLWTQDSRKRLFQRCAQVESDLLGAILFVTLTYPDAYPDAKTAKRHLKAWRKRLERRIGKVAVIWKLEFQARGAPHFHLAISDPGVDRANFMPWLSRSWYEVVNSGDEKHLGAGTRLDEWRGNVVSYLAGYCLKKDKEYQHNVPAGTAGVGRWWGLWNVPKPEWVELQLSDVVEYAGAGDEGQVAQFVKECLDARRARELAGRGRQFQKPVYDRADRGRWGVTDIDAAVYAHRLAGAAAAWLRGESMAGFTDVLADDVSDRLDPPERGS